MNNVSEDVKLGLAELAGAFAALNRGDLAILLPTDVESEKILRSALAEIERLSRELESLRANAWRYGKHLTACRLQTHPGSWCDCGWVRVRDTLTGEAKRPTPAVLSEIERRDAQIAKLCSLIDSLPITTEKLRGLRNAGRNDFDKQMNLIMTCLIQLREARAALERKP
jgi:hypothetical protein